MAIKVKADKTRTLSYEERDGQLIRLVSEYHVSGLTTEDARILAEALTAAGVPAYGDALVGFNYIFVIGRSARLVPGTKDHVVVEVVYELIERQQFNGIFRGSTSLQQIQTQVDRFGTPITVAHFYDGDPVFGTGTQYQGANVSVLAPRTTLRLPTWLYTDWPHALADIWRGRMNSTWWAGAPPLTWLVSDVTFQPANTFDIPAKWNFEFEFTHDPTGHDPQVAFQDQRTGRPPQDIVDGVGLVTVDWYPELDYNYLFPV